MNKINYRLILNLLLAITFFVGISRFNFEFYAYIYSLTTIFTITLIIILFRYYFFKETNFQEFNSLLGKTNIIFILSNFYILNAVAKVIESIKYGHAPLSWTLLLSDVLFYLYWWIIPSQLIFTTFIIFKLKKEKLLNKKRAHYFLIYPRLSIRKKQRVYLPDWKHSISL
jgi:hypothetical protein